MKKFSYTVIVLLPDHIRGDCSSEREWVKLYHTMAPDVETAESMALEGASDDYGGDQNEYAVLRVLHGHCYSAY